MAAEDARRLRQPEPPSDLDAERVVERESAAPEGKEDVNWRETALRLRAEMENYRKRQQRWAEDRVIQEKDRLLTSFLKVVDDLEKVLEHLDTDDPYYRGVKLTYDGMMNLLRTEDVEPIEAEGEAFDTTWHEAVSMVPAPRSQKVDMRVVEEMQRGYRRGKRVLRPARVVVARK